MSLDMTDDIPLAILIPAHVVASLIALLSACLVTGFGLFGRRSGALMIALIMASALAGATGFLFPLTVVGLARYLDLLLFGALALSIAGGLGRAGRMRQDIGGIGTAAVVYINLLAGLISAFQFVPLLQPFAPALAAPPLTILALLRAFEEPVFAAAQAALALLFLASLLHPLRMPGRTKKGGEGMSRTVRN